MSAAGPEEIDFTEVTLRANYQKFISRISSYMRKMKVYK